MLYSRQYLNIVYKFKNLIAPNNNNFPRHDIIILSNMTSSETRQIVSCAYRRLVF